VQKTSPHAGAKAVSLKEEEKDTGGPCVRIDGLILVSLFAASIVPIRVRRDKPLIPRHLDAAESEGGRYFRQHRHLFGARAH
jgi:hypothetical protein